MKNQPFHRRVTFAISGIRTAFQTESSFRTQLVFSVGALGMLFLLRPKAVWWAIVCLITAMILAAELINTALEIVVDLLHPDQHPMIARAKDCAAGAVLVLSIASLGIAAALIVERFLGSA